MKRILHTICLALLPFLVNAQIVITEIMFNPPESGTDTYEFIELFNNSSDAIDMEGYTLEGAEHTFTGTTIGAGEYLVMAVNQMELDALLGTSSIQWDSGALKNGGEAITLKDSNGDVVDMVEYGAGGDWPTEATGGGSSMELCDVDSDNNDPENWVASTKATGKIVNGTEIMASPGEANCEVVAAATITANSDNTFTPAEVTIFVGETVQWNNGGGFHNVNGNQSTFPGNPESFGNGAASADAWTYNYTFNAAGEYDYQCDPHAGLGMAGRVIVLDPYSEVDIVDVIDEDGEGVSTSLGDKVYVQGIVNSINWRSNGLDFILSDDSNNGIFIFNQFDDLGYTVTEGDEIVVKGVIGQFNGRTQVNAEEVSMMGSGNSTIVPEVVSNISEETEGKVVELKNFSIVDENDWKGTGSYNVEISDGTNTLEIRIINTTDLEGESIPQSPFDVTGVSSQYDTSQPYEDGYQLLIRYRSDIKDLSNSQDLDLLGNVTVYPNPVKEVLNIETDIRDIEKIIILNSLGMEVRKENFSDNLNINELPEGLYTLRLLKDMYSGDYKFVKF